MDLNNSTMYPCDLKNWKIFSSLESKFISNVRIAVVYGNTYFFMVTFLYQCSYLHVIIYC